MKYYYLIIFMLLCTVTFGQSQFSKGFDEGYKKGYCFDKGIGCIPPVPPISPIPTIAENLDSYSDGYNRGFKMGLDSNTKEENINKKSYKTAKSQFVEDITYQPPLKLIQQALENKQKQYESYYLSNKKRKEMFLENIKVARNRFNNDDFHNTVAYCKSALSTNYYNSEVYVLLGVSYYNLKDYDNSIHYLKKANDLGNPNAAYYLDQIKDKEEDFKFTKPINLGIRAGYSYNNIKPSYLVGAFIQGNRPIWGTKHMSGMAEILYINSAFLDNNYIDEQPREENDNLIQVNLNLKNRIIKRLDVIYGIGMSASLETDLMKLDLNGGLQYYFKHNFFVETRFNKSISEIYNPRNVDYITPDYNLMISIGFLF